ncbi:hypothetical protein JZ751_007842 [Albula glossodonta]|uniref:Lysine-specific demethylase 3B PWWP domain-containing protein n=1 Tax=Albula glossodonta TaxID=121402 RepID=A0A8T2PBF2_9TELE|nr:hypothetical protein JZ751_007842 [Albula glossodonta]
MAVEMRAVNIQLQLLCCADGDEGELSPGLPDSTATCDGGISYTLNSTALFLHRARLQLRAQHSSERSGNSNNTGGGRKKSFRGREGGGKERGALFWVFDELPGGCSTLLWRNDCDPDLGRPSAPVAGSAQFLLNRTTDDKEQIITCLCTGAGTEEAAAPLSVFLAAVSPSALRQLSFSVGGSSKCPTHSQQQNGEVCLLKPASHSDGRQEDALRRNGISLPLLMCLPDAASNCTVVKRVLDKISWTRLVERSCGALLSLWEKECAATWSTKQVTVVADITPPTPTPSSYTVAALCRILGSREPIVGVYPLGFSVSRSNASTVSATGTQSLGCDPIVAMQKGVRTGWGGPLDPQRMCNSTPPVKTILMFRSVDALLSFTLLFMAAEFSATFKPLVGKTVLGSITAVEFFSDRQLDFLNDDGAYQPYQVDKGKEENLIFPSVGLRPRMPLLPQNRRCSKWSSPHVSVRKYAGVRQWTHSIFTPLWCLAVIRSTLVRAT